MKKPSKSNVPTVADDEDGPGYPEELIRFLKKVSRLAYDAQVLAEDYVYPQPGREVIDRLLTSVGNSGRLLKAIQDERRK